MASMSLSPNGDTLVLAVMSVALLKKHKVVMSMAISPNNEILAHGYYDHGGMIKLPRFHLSEDEPKEIFTLP